MSNQEKKYVDPKLLNANDVIADVCIILEGSYPFVAGGVSVWTHELIGAQPHLTFHLLILVAPNSDLSTRYELPSNVIGVTIVTLQKIRPGKKKIRGQKKLLAAMEKPLLDISHDGGIEAVSKLMDLMKPHGETLGEEILINSKDAWNLLLRMYRNNFPTASFLDYFWTWRGLFGGLFAVLFGEMPKARIYHAVSTGYAGLYMARAKIETQAATLLTEHGIYTNERRIELSMADWLYEESDMQGLSIDKSRRNLRDLWMHSFESYSRACYAASDHIITLFEGNQSFQTADGADPTRMQVIPNGIDYEHYSKVDKVDGRRPTVALIGRVVPIKDVKTYIRSIALVREVITDVDAYLLGPMDEDLEYYEECKLLVEHLSLEENFTFTGRVALTDWMGKIDLMALTSISEGQPLVILEAGAASIPTVSTNVGACHDLIYGDSREDPPLGDAGEVVPLSNPSATARAMIRLLGDPELLATCGEAIRQRVQLYYNKDDLAETYGNLYKESLAATAETWANGSPFTSKKSKR